MTSKVDLVALTAGGPIGGAVGILDSAPGRVVLVIFGVTAWKIASEEW